jgi:hypothetical protein
MKILKTNEAQTITINMVPCDLCNETFECIEEFEWNIILEFWEKKFKIRRCPKCEKLHQMIKEHQLKEYIKNRDFILTKMKGGVK